DGKTGRHLGMVDLPAYPYLDPGRSHFFAPDGRYAASFAGDERLDTIVWDVAARRRLRTIRLPDKVGYLPARVENATRVFDPPRVSGAFAPDGSLLATWHPGEKPVVRIWDVRTGAEVRSFAETKAG